MKKIIGDNSNEHKNCKLVQTKITQFFKIKNLKIFLISNPDKNKKQKKINEEKEGKSCIYEKLDKYFYNNNKLKKKENNELLLDINLTKIE